MWMAALKAAPFVIETGRQLHDMYSDRKREGEREEQMTDAQRQQAFMNALATLRRQPAPQVPMQYVPSAAQAGRDRTSGLLKSLSDIGQLGLQYAATRK
jgi:hypothetical protein